MEWRYYTKEETGETVSMEVNEILSQMNVFEMPQQ